jgi:hypothetical protein
VPEGDQCRIANRILGHDRGQGVVATIAL